MKNSFRIALLIAAGALCNSVSPATVHAKSATKTPIHTPKTGSAERAAIMNALRKPVSKEVKQPVIFRVNTLRVGGAWAFYQGNARKKDDSDLGQAYLWGEMAALLFKSGGQWRVVHWGLATDTGIVDEIKAKYPHLPKGLLPY